MFCLLSKFHMRRPFHLTVKRVLKLPDAKLNVPLKQSYVNYTDHLDLSTATHSDDIFAKSKGIFHLAQKVNGTTFVGDRHPDYTGNSDFFSISYDFILTVSDFYAFLYLSNIYPSN